MERHHMNRLRSIIIIIIIFYISRRKAKSDWHYDTPSIHLRRQPDSPIGYLWFHNHFLSYIFFCPVKCLFYLYKIWALLWQTPALNAYKRQTPIYCLMIRPSLADANVNQTDYIGKETWMEIFSVDWWWSNLQIYLTVTSWTVIDN